MGQPRGARQVGLSGAAFSYQVQPLESGASTMLPSTFPTRGRNCAFRISPRRHEVHAIQLAIALPEDPPARTRETGPALIRASPRAWSRGRTAPAPIGGAPPPTPTPSVPESSGPRMYRWRPPPNPESPCPPSTRWSRTPGQKWKVSVLPLSAVRAQAVEMPANVICSRRKRAWLLITAPVRRWHSGSGTWRRARVRPRS